MSRLMTLVANNHTHRGPEQRQRRRELTGHDPATGSRNACASGSGTSRPCRIGVAHAVLGCVDLHHQEQREGSTSRVFCIGRPSGSTSCWATIFQNSAIRILARSGPAAR